MYSKMNHQYNEFTFICDLASDVENLPTATNKVDGYITPAAGSVAFVIEDCSTFMYGNDGEWHYLSSGSSGNNSGSGDGDYVLPTATSYRLGGIKVGDMLSIKNDGTLSVDVDALINDTATTAAIVDSGTEEITREEVNGAYDEAS